MGLWDRLTGRVRPDERTPTLPSAQLRQMLGATTGPQGVWSLGPGTRPGVDFVVQWRVQEPAFRDVMLTLRNRSHLIVLELQLDEEKTEVRVLEHAATLTERQGVLELSFMQDNRRGIVYEKTWDTTVGGATTTFEDDDVKKPLREATLAAGWSWRPVTKL